MLYSPIIQTLISVPQLQVDVLRLDLIDEEISGNKWFKLKYNIDEAKRKNHNTVLTFGGAYSNHIAATAAACKRLNISCIGIIRGEITTPLNPTLLKAEANGMQLHFVNREFYSNKDSEHFSDYLKEKFGKFYLIPEGGNNEMGILGCKEICNPDWNYNYIFCACGTGATYTGILANSSADQTIVGVNVLKGENTMLEEVRESMRHYFPIQTKEIKGNEALQTETISHSCITNLYAFKGYASYNPELIKFKIEFENEYKLKLDYIYTTKLMYALFDLIHLKKIKKYSRVLMVHSGGLQGNVGFEERYQFKPKL